jgi:hypothetical protein
MRSLAWAGALGLMMVGHSGDQNIRRCDEPGQDRQRMLECSAQQHAEQLADRLKGTLVGSLTPQANQVIARWDFAVRTWKREKGAGAAPLLAEGVSFDCLGRLEGVKTRILSSEQATPFFSDLAAARPGRAVTAFNAALKLDPRLVEARMRAARIRSLKDTSAARELEQIADDEEHPVFAYLAAISRAQVAQIRRDVTGGIHWYQRALQIHPLSTAATIGLGSLKSSAALPLDGLDTGDLYYTYPCRILTTDVDQALSARTRSVAVQ